MKQSIIILGMHRSGTSVVSGLTSLLGAYAGASLMPATKDNPKGYFENNKIYILNERILRENNATWDDLYFSCDDISPEKILQYIADAKSVLENELKYVKRIVIKDPRICILFPIWEQALKQLDIDIKVILVYRSPLEVAYSLKQRNKISIEKSLMLWSDHFIKAEYYSRDYPRFFVEYDSDFSNFKYFISQLANFIGVDATEASIEKSVDFYSPSLKHHQLGLDNINEDLPNYLINIIKLLLDKKFDDIDKFDIARKDFNLSKKYYLYNYKKTKSKLTSQEKKIKDQLSNITSKEEKIKKYKSTINDKEKDILRIINKNNIEKERMEVEYNSLKKILKKSDEELYFSKNKLEKNKKTLDSNKEILEKNKKKLEENKETLEKNKERLEENKNTFSIIKKEQIKNDKKTKNIIKNKDQYISEIKKTNKIINFRLKNSEYIFNKIFNKKKSYQKIRKAIKNTIFFRLKIKTSPLLKSKKIIRDKATIINSNMFSALYYFSRYPDVWNVTTDPIEHYCRYGWKEGRNPSSLFDTNRYLGSNPDVVSHGINPLVHYIRYGQNEGRIVLPADSNHTPNHRINNHPTKKNRAVPATPLVSNSNNNTEYYWDNSITVIQLLRKSKKIVNKNIPSNIITASRIQLNNRPLKVSVIMPTWNRANSICQSIDSILSQSFLPYEIIVSDDGSTDGTIDIIKEKYAKEISNKRLKLVLCTHNGVSSARNEGLAVATGDLIAYLDSDNCWRVHYLLIMVASFSDNDELNCAYAALDSHDKNKNKNMIRATPYRRKQLVDSNFIDLNVFIHRKIIFDQFGGFDTELKRLVDWDLIIKYTKHYIPALIPFVGVDYYLDDKKLKNITTTVSLEDNRQRVYEKHFSERLQYGHESLQLAYVLWDFPALSQTFVIEELKWLVLKGYDVIVYYSVEPDKAAILDFDIQSYQVKHADELANLLAKYQRNFCHSHFAYPTVTRLTYPACLKAMLPFTFMPHAVDIFHHENKKRNKIGEIAQHPLCKKIFVHGEFHKKFIENCGVPNEKIAFNIQAVNTADFEKYKRPPLQTVNNKNTLRGVVITRFVEKKGLSTLIEAAVMLKEEKVVFDIYGYGPLEADYKQHIKQLGLNNVLLKGVLTSQEAVAKVYQQSDFLIAPCVVAENGDMDGFPTVILEAMAVGLPVITTDIAAIPDYLTDGVDALIAPAGDIQQIAERVRQLIIMSPERKMAMVKRSQAFLAKKIGVKRTMQMLLDTWQEYSLDIFLVTFNTEKYDDQAETFEIIKRIFKYTTTPFTLTIIDNNSDKAFWDKLCEQLNGYSNVRLIRKYDNTYCGPASNIALEHSEHEYAIYLCSKEGFIKKHGWERTLLAHMRDNPNDAIAGHHCQLPRYIYGKEYQQLPEFLKFRNPNYAQENQERIFKHIQGGIFIIRKAFIQEHGGFNPATPHGGMDIEMSYYIESLGYDLGGITEVSSLTVKTLPKLPTILNENTVVAHPLTVKSVTEDLDTLEQAAGHRCNMCGWKGRFSKLTTDSGQLKQQCPDCYSTGFGRSLLKLLSNNHHIYREETCLMLTDDTSLEKRLEKFFKVLLVTESEKQLLIMLEKIKSTIDCIIVDPELMTKQNALEIWPQLVKKLSPIGEIIFADALFLDNEKVTNCRESHNDIIHDVFSSIEDQYSIEYIDFTSYCLAYDWRRFGCLSRSLQ